MIEKRYKKISSSHENLPSSAPYQKIIHVAENRQIKEESGKEFNKQRLKETTEIFSSSFSWLWWNSRRIVLDPFHQAVSHLFDRIEKRLLLLICWYHFFLKR